MKDKKKAKRWWHYVKTKNKGKLVDLAILKQLYKKSKY